VCALFFTVTVRQVGGRAWPSDEGRLRRFDLGPGGGSRYVVQIAIAATSFVLFLAALRVKLRLHNTCKCETRAKFAVLPSHSCRCWTRGADVLHSGH
jgi:hypothetical protein